MNENIEKLEKELELAETTLQSETINEEELILAISANVGNKEWQE